jgi:RNA-directed DNA polymerase
VGEKDELPQPIPKVGWPRVQFDGYVAALEDKIVQRAVVALLNAIYEEDFLGISYGFRPGRGTHDALDALSVGIHSKKVSFILDADIQSFFDEISQEWLIRFLEHRIGDRRIIRLLPAVPLLTDLLQHRFGIE